MNDRVSETPVKSRALLKLGLASAVLGVAVGLLALQLWVFRSTRGQTGSGQPPGASAPVVQLVLTGDVMMARNVERSLVRDKRDFTFPMSNVMKYLQNADAAFCNLETAVAASGEAIKKTYTFLSPPETAPALATAGFDVVSLANNHVLDYGHDALAETVRHVEAAGMKGLGLAGDGQPQRPAIIEAKGVKIGFLAYVDPESKYGDAPEYAALGGVQPAKATYGQCGSDIVELKRQADIVVVSVHWGTEYRPEPDRRQIELGRYLIEAGADIVAGHHPHVQQEPEWYRGGVILYSLGNFVFDQWSRPPTRLSRLYRAYVDKDGVKGLEYLPLDKERGTWLLLPGSDRFTEVPAPPARRPLATPK